MKTKLKIFIQFVQQLFPHEVIYLQSKQQFVDPDNLKILADIAQYHQQSINSPCFNPQIDKRKYSRIKGWISKQLMAIDVDLQFEWITHVEKQIMMDTIQPEEEQQIIRSIKTYHTPYYYFMKFYELLQHYRQYLLIRMRHKDHRIVQDFLRIHENAYHRSQQTYEQLHQITLDIVKQYKDNKTETLKWELWLKTVLQDETMDGMNRYFAAIRLTFIYLNYNYYHKLLEMYESLDRMFRSGLFYSRRILVNYYSNRLLVHSKLGELEEAVKYGFLSIRYKNADYLQYVNNLSAILLRLGQKEQALSLMKEAIPEIRSTKSFHNKVGAMAFYMICLNENGQAKISESYAQSFLREHKEEVFEQRWHLFFSTYMQALIQQEKYDKALRIMRRYKIMEKEKNYQNRPLYLPTLSWYYAVAAYKEGRMNRYGLVDMMIESAHEQIHDDRKRPLVEKLVSELEAHIPLLMKDVKTRLFGMQPFK